MSRGSYNDNKLVQYLLGISGLKGKAMRKARPQVCVGNPSGKSKSGDYYMHYYVCVNMCWGIGG